ncbi:Aquaporin-3 [Sparganum proliferum]
MKHVTESYVNWQHRLADKIRLTGHRTVRNLIRETMGSMIFVAFATGVVAQANLTDGDFGLMLDLSVGYAAAWILGNCIAGSESMTFLNPALGLANALVGRLNFIKMLLYWLAELIGGFLGGLLVIWIYWEKIQIFAKKFDNGELRMNTTGSVLVGSVKADLVTLFIDQLIVGTVSIMGMMAAIDKNNWNLPRSLVIFYGSLLQFLKYNDFSVNTSASSNPALDLGPRLALLCTGWGTNAFSYGNYAFVVFLFTPFLSAILGTLLYELLIGIHLPGAGENSKNRSRTPRTESPSTSPPSK